MSKIIKNNTKTAQSSITDYLMEIMPGLRVFQKEDRTDPRAAESLYSLWQQNDHKISKNLYKKPTTFSREKVDLMAKEGLVQPNGGNIEITDKGAETLRVMVLGDDNSIFDKEASVSYREALQKTDLKTAKNVHGKNQDQWWNTALK